MIYQRFTFFKKNLVIKEYEWRTTLKTAQRIFNKNLLYVYYDINHLFPWRDNKWKFEDELTSVSNNVLIY